jgi:death on curing protein
MNVEPRDSIGTESIAYLSVDDLFDLHGALFGITSQQAADRLRSRSVLEGALARPQQHAVYAGADLALQAAVLAHGIAEGQAFIDGNKRTTLVALAAFLEINGYDLSMTEPALAHTILELSQELTVEHLAERMRRKLVRSA